jgi:hypothetical protein
MDDDEQTPEVQSPAEQAVIGASIVCFISLIIMYCIAELALQGLGLFWAEFLPYGIIPISATFLCLYRSCWHPEITGAALIFFVSFTGGFHP